VRSVDGDGAQRLPHRDTPDRNAATAARRAYRRTGADHGVGTQKSGADLAVAVGEGTDVIRVGADDRAEPRDSLDLFLG
jgi:hypothetical protein